MRGALGGLRNILLTGLSMCYTEIASADRPAHQSPAA
jgi:hypothetical protein